MQEAKKLSFFKQATEQAGEKNREILNSLITGFDITRKKVVLIGEEHYELTAKILLLESIDLLIGCQERGIKPVIILEHISSNFNQTLFESCKNKEFDPESLTPSKQNGHYIDDKPWDQHKKDSVFDHPAILKRNNSDSSTFLSGWLFTIIAAAITNGIPVLGAENKHTGFGYLPYGYFGKADSSGWTSSDTCARNYVRLYQGNLAFSEEISFALESYDLVIFLGGSHHISDIEYDTRLNLKIDPKRWGPITFKQKVKGLKSLLLDSYSKPLDCIAWSCRDSKPDKKVSYQTKFSTEMQLMESPKIKYDILTEKDWTKEASASLLQILQPLKDENQSHDSMEREKTIISCN